MLKNKTPSLFGTSYYFVVIKVVKCLELERGEHYMKNIFVPTLTFLDFLFGFHFLSLKFFILIAYQLVEFKTQILLTGLFYYFLKQTTFCRVQLKLFR